MHYPDKYHNDYVLDYTHNVDLGQFGVAVIISLLISYMKYKKFILRDIVVYSILIYIVLNLLAQITGHFVNGRVDPRVEYFDQPAGKDSGSDSDSDSNSNNIQQNNNDSCNNKRPSTYSRQFDTGLDCSSDKLETMQEDIADIKNALSTLQPMSLTSPQQKNSDVNSDFTPDNPRVEYDNSWSMVSDQSWTMPNTRPPVCISDDKCPVCPTYSATRPYSDFLSKQDWSKKHPKAKKSRK